MWEFISNNSFVGAFTSGLALLFVGGLISLGIRKYRANRIYNILHSGLTEKGKIFLPTTYLSAQSGYTQSQVEALCCHHKKICRNEKELESWRIS